MVGVAAAAGVKRAVRVPAEPERVRSPSGLANFPRIETPDLVHIWRVFDLESRFLHHTVTGRPVGQRETSGSH